ncbi:DUF2256 domain-containing protein [Shimia litoralis]|uniref:DUF2256 domain-containing protein n=1 Tax=Shimia litoralis TaxID=420403 RepID=A0A4U7N4X6_9RHOB|nr:DUF2256 domain-containing protein [Shimia litoralis]TKZ20849.1 DUF2256 domain-containing protein [Shimia litoralis]
MRKSELPFKTCPVSCRPFSWIGKWPRSWSDVRYCSERCRRSRKVRSG